MPDDSELEPHDEVAAWLTHSAPQDNDLADILERDIVEQLVARQFEFDLSSASPTLGRYELENKLGEGGMGAVFSAYDPKLDRNVAVKCVRGGTTHDDASQRRHESIVREARAGARISHPNVVTIHDVGIHRDQCYVVMERVEGVTLEQWLKSRPSWRQIVKVFIAAGQGLVAIHERGLVHRDFKPRNVLLSRDENLTKITDFGLAHDVVEDSPTGSDGERRTTVRGIGGGTAAYMSPEQYDGNSSTKSDQFSYCVALYEALYGQLPFDGNTRDAYAFNVAEGNIRSPGIRRDLPRGLLEVLYRGLSPAPEDRHPSMPHLIERLESLLGRRRRIQWGMSVASLVLGGVAFGIWVSAATPCSSTTSIWADQQRDGLEQRLTRDGLRGVGAEGVLTDLDTYASDWVDTRQEVCERNRDGAQREAVTDLRNACLDRQQVSFEAIVEHITATDDSELRRTPILVDQLAPPSDCSAERVLEKSHWANALASSTDRAQTAELQSLWDDLSQRIAEANRKLFARDYEQSTRISAEVAATAEQRGLRYLEAKALTVQGRSEIQSANRLGSDGRSQRDQGYRRLRRAVDLAIESGSDRLAAEIYLSLAECPADQCNKDLRTAWLNAAQSHMKSLDDPQTLPERLELTRGNLAMSDRQFASAQAAFERSRTLSGRGYWWEAATNRLADAHRLAGQHEQARVLWTQLLRIVEDRVPPDPQRASTLFNLALVSGERGDPTAAIDLAEQAYAAFIPSPDLVEHEDQHYQIAIARWSRQTDDLDKARSALHRLTELERDATTAIMRINALDELVEVELAAGNASAALDAAARFVDRAIEYGGADCDKALTARLMRAQASLAAGHLANAHAESQGVYATTRDRDPYLSAHAAHVDALVAHTMGSVDLARDRQREAERILSGIGATVFVEQLRQRAREHGINGGGHNER